MKKNKLILTTILTLSIAAALTGCGDNKETADNTKTTNAVVSTSVDGTKAALANATTGTDVTTSTEIATTSEDATTPASDDSVTPVANDSSVTPVTPNGPGVIEETPTAAPTPVVDPTPEPTPEPAPAPTPDPTPAPTPKKVTDASALIATGWTNLTNCQLAEGDNIVIGEWTYLGAIKGFFAYAPNFDPTSKTTICNWATAKGMGNIKRVGTPYHMTFDGKSSGVGFYFFEKDNPGLDTSGTNPGGWQGNGYAETWTYLNPIGHSASNGKPDVDYLMSTY